MVEKLDARPSFRVRVPRVVGDGVGRLAAVSGSLPPAGVPVNEHHVPRGQAVGSVRPLPSEAGDVLDGGEVDALEAERHLVIRAIVPLIVLGPRTAGGLSRMIF